MVADYVTLEQGTGCVHTAPGHGQEDYETGLRYGMDIYSPVDESGRFVNDVEHFAGMQVFEANAKIIAHMREIGCLMGQETISHQYPHCWRCKNPVIFRATAQWFIMMERNDLRQNALNNIRKVRWIPAWGEDRIYNMIENRPDWCISRQRVWGVPIVAFYCNDCDHLSLKKEVVDFVAEKVEKGGADVWFDLPESELLPLGTTCENCGGTSFRKDTDILDVWFDSGMSHAAVVEPNPDLPWPADMYLEGSDQHRGWFHSSLLESVGTRGTAPYKNVLTHGYVVDGDGRKMSKSLGNVVAPQDVIKKYGAEILRLWVSYEDYRNDIAISNDMLKHLADAYRRIRNTSKYLLGSLYDYDATKDAVPYEDLLDMDKWILHRTQKLVARVRKAYDDFEFHAFFHAFHNFCVVDMSSFYMDVLKDRMYTSKADSQARRSGQTAMHIVLDTMVKLMAPILSFTAEEVWQYMSEGDESIHLQDMPEVNLAWVDDDLDECWSRMIEVRGEILKRLELARKEKLIGHSLDALVQVFAAGETYELIEQFEDQLASICIVSEAELFGDETPIPDDAFASDTIENLNIRVAKAYGEKCPRCWQFRTTIGEDAAHPDICAQCAAALS
jgi:isoleucyl-tRNA synthetase